MTEKEVSKELRKYWRLTGWYVIRNQQNIGSHKGLADYLVIKDGVHIFVEVKGEKGRQSEKQNEFSKNIINAGGHYVICRNVNEFINFIEGSLYAKRNVLR